jgi:hypothetical protein
MPGLTNRRNAMREGNDWTKGYKHGGTVKKSKKKGPSIKGKGYGPYTKLPSGTKS